MDIAANKLQPHKYYAIALGSLLILLLSWNLAAALGHHGRPILALARKCLSQTLISVRLNGSSDVSVAAGLLIAALAAANILACVIFVKDVPTLAQRSGTLALINLVPLYLGGSRSLWINIACGVSHPVHGFAHRWIGRICLALAISHGLARLSMLEWKATYMHVILMVLLCLLGTASTILLRRRFYEVFVKSHVALSAGLQICLWLHISKGKNFETLCLGLAALLWSIHYAFWVARLAIRNLGGRTVPPGSIVALTDQGGSVKALALKISLRRPWRLSHGQYIYITIPSVPRTVGSAVQSHPYMIAWAPEVADKITTELHLLVQCQRGFSDVLRLARATATIWIDGPYGRGPKLDDFDKVLFLASGAGVAAHLLAIRHLLQGHNARTAQVRRLSLLWVLESEGLFYNLFCMECS
ncbi:hypothetical protein LTR78_007436 [Recurvomyces mirabilis]|uniref:ferric-chelate reductase (NADPH) n=1 Tax=Recurvomyces mirabilis TaxID=574656 RepID=A0AAE0TU86_9PEZI|nr:hypothetical protein LTR78_007436 [Recurvomyces mirabilis]KAK5160055.1 hypothetical protein LTS14_002161 [Recurvomyces mirabilis]